MKTLLLAITLLCAFTIVQSQELAKFAAEKIIENADGVVIKESDEEGYIFAELSDYYTFDIFRMDVRNVVNEYSDLDYLTNWTRTSSTDYPANYIILMIETTKYETEYLRIFYSLNTPTVMFFFDQELDE